MSDIDILKEQLEKLDDEYSSKSENWQIQTKSYIKDIFGEDSVEFEHISKFTFYPYHAHSLLQSELIQETNERTKNIKDFIKNCINTLEKRSQNESPNMENVNNGNRGNFISRMSEGWAIFLVGVVFFTWGGFCYSFGVWQTKNTVDTTKDKMERKIDSLFKVTQSFKMMSDTTTNNQTQTSVNSESNKQ